MIANGSEEKAIVQADKLPAELQAVEARAISKFAEASMLELSEHEVKSLRRSVPVDEVLALPNGQIYLEWAWYATVLDDTFGPSQWALTPAPWSPKLYREGKITYREYCLWVRGQFAANAVGHHEEQRQTSNFGDAAEATYANALVRCCKRLGVARDLWSKKKIDAIKKQMKAPKPQPQPTIVDAEVLTPDPLIQKMVDAFGSIGVDVAQLEDKMGHRMSETTEQELKSLRVMYKSIQDKHSTVEQNFGGSK